MWIGYVFDVFGGVDVFCLDVVLWVENVVCLVFCEFCGYRFECVGMSEVDCEVGLVYC